MNRIVVLLVVLALLFSAVGTAPAKAAGIYTHSVFVRRAIDHLTGLGGYTDLVNILNTYVAEVNVGALFPDVTLAGIDDEWAEWLHDTVTLRGNYAKFLQYLVDKGYDKNNWGLLAVWYKEFMEDPEYTARIPEFRAALMAEILEHFNHNPRTADDEKMIAFLFGVIAHQEADLPWHWGCTDPTWRGLECAAAADLGLNEYQLEMIIKWYHGGLSANFDYVGAIYNTIMAASDAAGYRRPHCHSEISCASHPGEPIWSGIFNTQAYWYEPAIPPGFPWQWAPWRDWVYYYTPGGLYDGGALVAGAWMQTWDRLSNPKIYRVKPTGIGNENCSSWNNACTLQSALSLAVNGEIWLAAGTYTPATTDLADPRTAAFRLRKSAPVYGGFDGTESSRDERDPAANLTILSGDIDNDDSQKPLITDPTTVTGNTTNSYHVVIGASDSTLDGVTITAGYADQNTTYCQDSLTAGQDPGCGGGMINVGTNPTIRNVTFMGSVAAIGGGALLNFKNQAVIENVTFIGNMSGNYGGGVTNFEDSSTFRNVTFTNNQAFINGGGADNCNSTASFTNVTFYNNLAGAGSGGAAGNFCMGHIQFHNSIFWGNAAPAGPQLYDGDVSITVTSSIVQDGYTGAGSSNIITADPMLGDLGSYGGQTPTIPLLPGSSAFEATNADCPATDQRGMLRESTCDIGAYESHGFDLVPGSGNNQSTFINHPFALPLTINVISNEPLEPVNGGLVSFTAPSSGASAFLSPSPVTIAGASASVNATANSIPGAYHVTASASGATSASFMLSNEKLLATVSLSNLVHIYDGTPKPVTVTTIPGGLRVAVTYNGSPEPPGDVGSYLVVATVESPTYQGVATGTLIINPEVPEYMISLPIVVSFP